MRRCIAWGLLFLFTWQFDVRPVDAQSASSATKTDTAPDSQSGDESMPAMVEDHPAWLFPVEQLNQHLPNWLRIGGEFRNRPEGRVGIGFTNTNDSYLLYRLRIHVAIQPNEWLRFFSEVQDARIYFNHVTPSANPYQDTYTLWQAYAQVGNSKEGLADVLGGREVLRFGDERVIGPSDWLNVGRTFNVGRIDFHPSNADVSIFASSVVPGEDTDLHNALPGNNFYGVYVSLQSLVPRAKFEPYVLWRVAPSNLDLPEDLGRGHLNEITYGLHWKGSLPAAIDYDSEFDGQTGSLGGDSLRAWAGFAGFGKRFRKSAATPRVFLEGNYASGTKNLAGHSWNTFDQIYPSNHDKYGFADLVGRRNLVQFRTGIEEFPTKKWIVKQQFEGYWLATSHDNFYGSSGTVAVPARPGANPHIGNELDLVAEYQWSKGLSFGFGYARMFAGQFLKTTTPGHDYSYPYAYFEYNFSKSGFHFPITRNRVPTP